MHCPQVDGLRAVFAPICAVVNAAKDRGAVTAELEAFVVLEERMASLAVVASTELRQRQCQIVGALR